MHIDKINQLSLFLGYLGCFSPLEDSGEADFVSPLMTVQLCVEICRGKGDTVANVQARRLRLGKLNTNIKVIHFSTDDQVPVH